MIKDPQNILLFITFFVTHKKNQMAVCNKKIRSWKVRTFWKDAFWVTAVVYNMKVEVNQPL